METVEKGGRREEAIMGGKEKADREVENRSDKASAAGGQRVLTCPVVWHVSPYLPLACLLFEIPR